MSARFSVSALLAISSLCACSSGASSNSAATAGTHSAGQSAGGNSANGGNGGATSHSGNATGQAGSGGAQSNGGSQAMAGTAGTSGSAGATGGSGAGGADTAGVLSCPDYMPPAGATLCRDSDECPDNNFCSPPSNAGFCGSGVAPPPPCAADIDCTMSPASVGLICDPLRNTGSCDHSGNCYPPCSEVACLQYQRCASDTTHCEWVPCDDGYECFEGEVCDPTFATVDVHGCRAADCVTDGYACPEGSLCYPDAGNLRSTTQDAHGCVQMHCSEGFTCPANMRCDDQEMGTGCVQLTCAMDADCDCGPCVQGGRCFGEWWICTPPPPP